MSDPLLRSTRVLEALFHEGAIVCEADPDRAFYQEVNERLLAANRNGAADCLFLNAQNKQTLRRIIGPLRAMGIPAAAIVDLDILRKGNDDLRELMKAASVPGTLSEGFGQIRGQLEAAFKTNNLVAKRNGIKALDPSNRESGEALLNSLAEYGIFVTPPGELELWLRHLDVLSGTSDQKRDWLSRIFEKMGSDPDSAGYLRPADDDVWTFIDSVGRWIANPARKGMPV